MTRSRELRRIERAIAERNRPELEWALSECELRKKVTKGRSARWYHIERTVRAALDDLKPK
jgi:hypothetical protein